MNKTTHNPDAVAETPPVIAPETIILDIISAYRHTETIFKHLEEETGTCVLCQGLFLTLGEAARQFGFNLDNALRHLHAAVDGGEPS
jgi:hypothetical protein